MSRPPIVFPRTEKTFFISPPTARGGDERFSLIANEMKKNRLYYVLCTSKINETLGGGGGKRETGSLIIPR